MEALLVKILATALAFSQVTVTPNAIKTEFSRDRDQQQVTEFLQAGCAHMIKAFEIENINLDDLIETAMEDPQAFGGEARNSAAFILPICKRRIGNFASASRLSTPSQIWAR